MDEETMKSMLSEGFHTAFRKASDSKQAWQIWKLIKQLPNEEWGAIIDFVYEGLKGEIG